MKISQLSNVSALQFFQISRFAGVLILSVLFVKMGLSQTDVSYIEFFLYLSNLFAFFWSYGFKNSYLSYFPTISDKSKKDFLSTLFVIYLIVGLIAACCVYFIGTKGLIFTWESEEIGFVPIAALYLIINTPNILIEHAYIIFNDSKRLIQYAFLVLFLPICIVLIALGIEMSVRSVCLALLVIAGIKLIYFILIPLRLYSSFRICLGLIKPFLLFSIPLVLHALVGNGVVFIDGYLVQHYFPVESFAIYRYGAKELPFVVLFVGSVMTALVPRAVQELSGALAVAKIETTKLMHLLYPISVVLILISPFIFPIVYDDSFKESAYLFNIYALIITSRILLPQLVLFGKHFNKALLIITLVESIINVLLSLFLLQYWGMRGIAVASVIAFMLAKIFMMLYNYLKFNLEPSSYINLRYYMIYNIILFISFYISLSY